MTSIVITRDDQESDRDGITRVQEDLHETRGRTIITREAVPARRVVVQSIELAPPRRREDPRLQTKGHRHIDSGELM